MNNAAEGGMTYVNGGPPGVFGRGGIAGALGTSISPASAYLDYYIFDNEDEVQISSKLGDFTVAKLYWIADRVYLRAPLYWYHPVDFGDNLPGNGEGMIAIHNGRSIYDGVDGEWAITVTSA